MPKRLKASLIFLFLILTGATLALKYSAPRSLADLRHDRADVWYKAYAKCADEAGKGSPMAFKTALRDCQEQTDKTVLGNANKN